jgi:hypothetical protein
MVGAQDLVRIVARRRRRARRANAPESVETTSPCRARSRIPGLISRLTRCLLGLVDPESHAAADGLTELVFRAVM